MKKGNERYIQFPLLLLRELHEDHRKAIYKMLCCGIYYFAERVKCTPEDAARQVIYDLYRHPKKMSDQLKNSIRKLNSENIGQADSPVWCDADSGRSEYVSQHESTELINAMNEDEDLRELVFEHYKDHCALKSLGLKHEYPVKIRPAAKEVFKAIPEKEPMPHANTKMLFHFLAEPPKENDLIEFAAFIAVKSILGQKVHSKTNKGHILARMIGYSSIKHIPQELPPHLSEIRKKYEQRYHMDKLLVNLQLNWNVLIWSQHVRGMYIGMADKTSLEILEEKARTSTEKHKLKELQKKKNDVREQAKRKRQLK